MIRYLTLRELRNTPSALWRKLRGNATVALTSKGVPRALVIGVREDDLETTLRTVARAKAQVALSRLRETAAARGLDRLGEAELEAEISASRRRRR